MLAKSSNDFSTLPRSGRTVRLLLLLLLLLVAKFVLLREGLEEEEEDSNLQSGNMILSAPLHMRE